MPSFQKLDKNDVTQFLKRRQEVVDPHYLAFIETLGKGDWGAIILDEQDTQRSVKRRMTLAAKHNNKKVKYRTIEGRLYLTVTEFLDEEPVKQQRRGRRSVS